MIWQIHQCFLRRGVHWWVAPVIPQAKVAFDRAVKYLPKGLFVANKSEKTITIYHPANPGEVWSVWFFKGGEKPDNLYGEDVESAVIDEASRLREASWHAVRSTLTATRGPIRIIGNVKGRGNWFYKMARRAQGGARGHEYHKIIAYDAVRAGVLDSEEVEDARAVLPEHIFKELYECVPSDDGGNPFGLQAIEDCVIELSDSRPFVWGWDLAKSVDWTVGIALDRKGRVCRFHRFQMPWGATEDRILELAKCFGYIDSTGNGDPVVEAIIRRQSPLRGFTFTSKSKQQIMEGLAVAIQSGRIGFPDNEIRNELDTFEYEHTRTAVKYSAPYGLHDDCVAALALAWSAYRHMITRYRPKLRYSSTRSLRQAA